MFVSDKIGIVADDLTGANDCSLQFHLRGCNTEILLDYSSIDANYIEDKQVLTLSTESRNIETEEALKQVREAVSVLKGFNIEYYFKKIDSTMRGHVAKEALVMLEELDYDAGIILPAFPSEGRVTVGGYHLLRGIPLERTDMARDPYSPILESNIPKILKHQLEENQDIVGLIELDTVMKGAGPILVELNNLVKQGKKLIVVDAVSDVDIKQVALVVQKSNHKILPIGASGFAKAMGDVWLNPEGIQKTLKTVERLPKLVISGSATKLTNTQIQTVKSMAGNNTFFIGISVEDVINNNIDNIVNLILPDLTNENIVVVHSSDIVSDLSNFSDKLLDYDITKVEFAGMISDFLSKVCEAIVKRRKNILITIGGETSYKCCDILNSTGLELLDEVAPAIPLCIDRNGQMIITKSGNLGNNYTLVEILKYFEKYE